MNKLWWLLLVFLIGVGRAHSIETPSAPPAWTACWSGADAKSSSSIMFGLKYYGITGRQATSGPADHLVYSVLVVSTDVSHAQEIVQSILALDNNDTARGAGGGCGGL